MLNKFVNNFTLCIFLEDIADDEDQYSLSISRWISQADKKEADDIKSESGPFEKLLQRASPEMVPGQEMFTIDNSHFCTD